MSKETPSTEGPTVEAQSEVLDFDQGRTSEQRPVHPALAPALQQVQPPAQVPANSQPMVAMSNQELVTFAVMNDRIDMLDRVIALKNAEEDRAAKIEFDRHFAEMQKDYVAVAKTKKGQFGPYADINDILAVYGPILSSHGFSWSFPEEPIPGKEGWKTVFCVIRGYGHSEKTPFVCPPAPENKGSSAIQKEAGNTTFGKRQAFNSAVGVFLTNEDKDGDLTFEEGVKLAQSIQLIREATTRAERKAAYIAAIQAPDLTDREKAIISEESKRKDKELLEAGVRE